MIFRKSKVNLNSFHRGKKRAKNLGKGDLLDWIDMAGTQLARDVQSYRQHPEGMTAHIIKDNALVLAGLCDELAQRHQ